VTSTILRTEFLLQIRKQWEDSAILLASNRPQNKDQTKKQRKTEREKNRGRQNRGRQRTEEDKEQGKTGEDKEQEQEQEQGPSRNSTSYLIAAFELNKSTQALN
jgi:alpha-galactosidase/6-phospho-beta-glucosidase family protein